MQNRPGIVKRAESKYLDGLNKYKSRNNQCQCLGQRIADVTITLAAVDPCYSCTERLAVVDQYSKVTHDGESLLRLSREKTEQMKKELGMPGLKMEDL